MAAIGKPVAEKYRSSIFGDAPACEINRRRSSGGASINPITGEPLYNDAKGEDVSDTVSVSSNSSGSESLESAKVVPAVAAGVSTQQLQQQQNQPQTPSRRIPPGGYSTLHLG